MVYIYLFDQSLSLSIFPYYKCNFVMLYALLKHDDLMVLIIYQFKIELVHLVLGIIKPRDMMNGFFMAY